MLGIRNFLKTAFLISVFFFGLGVEKDVFAVSGGLGRPYCVVNISTKARGLKNSYINGSVVGGKDKYVAVKKGEDVQFEAECYGFSSKVAYYWCFGGDECRWERVGAGIISTKSKIVHRFNERGDYYVSVFRGDGVNSASDRIRVGVYSEANSDGYLNVKLAAGYPDKLVDRVDLSAEELFGEGARFAGFVEKKVMISGSNPTAKKVSARRELSLMSNRRVLDGYSFGINVDLPVWQDSISWYLNDPKLLFWDFPNSVIRDGVDTVSYRLSVPAINGVGAIFEADLITAYWRTVSENNQPAICSTPATLKAKRR